MNWPASQPGVSPTHRRPKRTRTAPVVRMNLARLYLASEQKGMARSELEKIEKMGRKYPNQDEVAKLLKTL